MKDTAKEINLLELIPVRNVQHEMNEEQKVVLLIPKFRSRLTVRYLLPLLAKPYFKLKLDTYGSFVWGRIDGRTTVLRIAEDMKAHYGESVEPVYERVGKFIQMMQREKFVTLNYSK